MDIPQLLPVGSKLKTNYSNTIYTVKKVSKECTCADPANGVDTTPHYHIVVRYPDGSEGYLNGYIFNVFEEIINVWNTKDKIILLNDDGTMRAVLPVEKKKPGRKPGTANKTNIDRQTKSETIKIRVTETTKRRLQWVRDNSTIWRGKSDADVIENLIEDHVTLQMFYHMELPRFVP